MMKWACLTNDEHNVDYDDEIVVPDIADCALIIDGISIVDIDVDIVFVVGVVVWSAIWLAGGNITGIW